ncbi:MAG: response regulator [Holophagales bacterium]|jgi:two-component system chemotaxis response regulator CheY|nr:response regulator [Holophagales bacterium]
MIELHNLSICLAEPSGVQANIIVTHLFEMGIEHVSKVSSGNETIKSLDGSIPPDLVMSALYLPDMTGTELLYSIRRSDAHSDTPFILISSETDPRNLEDVRQAGSIAILPKPFTKAQLLRSILNTLDFLNAEEEASNDDSLDLKSQKVLIVDDSKVSRKHVKRVLERIGFENFTEVADGREAIPLIDSVLYDLVVTDYNMPNIDGLGLVDYIRHKSVQASVPILMVSSEQDEGRLAAVMDAGVSAICDKPFETGLVRSLVKQMIKGEGQAE